MERVSFHCHLDILTNQQYRSIMSDSLFGDFKSDRVTSANTAAIKQAAESYGLLVWFNDDLTDAEGIRKAVKVLYPNLEYPSDWQVDLLGSGGRQMLEENPHAGNTDIFFISSYEQPLNSSDVLDVWDRYSKEELFPDGDDRTVFDERCAENLTRLKAVFEHFIEVLRPSSLRVFLPDQYDCGVPVKRMTVDEMIDDVLQQLTGALGFIDSAIYDICC